jgi:hexosaminidase
MLYPRLAAIAETGWSPKDGKNWDDFLGRLVKQFRRYEQMGVYYSRNIYAVKIDPQVDAPYGAFRIHLAGESDRPRIFYTLDGTEPGPSSIPNLAPSF